MFNRILVPLDGSLLAECAMPHAVTLAEAEGAQMTLVHVMNGRGNGDMPCRDPLRWYLQRQEMEIYLKELCTRFASTSVQIDSSLLEGSVAPAITNFAAAVGADLLVMSSHGRSGLNAWNVSGIVDELIQTAKISFVLVPARYQYALQAQYRRILVPLDGSPRAECVLPLAIHLAVHCRGELVLAHVVARPRYFSQRPISDVDKAWVNAFIENNLREASHYLQQVAQGLPVPSSSRLSASDSPLNAIHDSVKTDAVDMVMLTAHGHTCSQYQPYGSLVTSLIYHVNVPLLVVQDLPPAVIVPGWAEVETRTALDGELRLRQARHPHSARR